MELILTRTTENIAVRMLNTILYSNDMVKEPKNEQAFDYWKGIVSDALIAPVVELGEDFFTDVWIENFCDGDSDFINSEVEEYPILEELMEALNDFFEEYDNFETGPLENSPVYVIELTKSELEIIAVALNPSDHSTLSKDIVYHCVRSGKKWLPYLEAAQELADKIKDITKQSKHQ